MLGSALTVAIFPIFLAAPAAPPPAPPVPPVASAIAAVEPAAPWNPEDGDCGRAARLLDELMAPLAGRQPGAGAESALRRLIEQLGDEDWPRREAASRELVGCGVLAVPLLRGALDHRDPEIVFRARLILDEIPATALERVLAGLDACSGSAATGRPRKIMAELAIIHEAASAALARFERGETAVAGAVAGYLQEAEASGDGRAADGHRLTARIVEARCAALKFIAAGLKDEVAELAARREDYLRREVEKAGEALAVARPEE